MDIDWAAPAAWANRAARFRTLRDTGYDVLMELVPRVANDEWEQLCHAWLTLPSHPSLLRAVAASRDGVYVAYAAIDWWKPVLEMTSALASRLAARFGQQIASVLRHVTEHASPADLALFRTPFAYIDLDDAVRIGFDVALETPSLDEPELVRIAGTLWASLLSEVPDDDVGMVIRRCLDPDPRARFGSLKKLDKACRALDAAAPREGERLVAWQAIEAGIAWRERGSRLEAHRHFQRALETRYYGDLATWGARVTMPVSVATAPAPPPPSPAPPTPARLAYLAGRDWLLARKLDEAREAFTTAISLDPMMLEALLLRREVDRMLTSLRATVGRSVAQPLDVPASLRDLRDRVIAGHHHEVIELLAGEDYAANPDAPLLRARLLALDGQLDAAASALTAITSGPHVDEARLALARVTLDRGAPDAALAIVDQLLARSPRDLGALELRARCLELAGHAGEASAAMRAFVAAVELASDVRLANL